MGQRSNDAAAKGVQTNSSVEECVGGMGHTAILTIYLLRSVQNTRILLQLKLYPISALLVELQSEDKKEEAFQEK